MNESQLFSYTFSANIFGEGFIIEEYKLNGKMHNTSGPARVVKKLNGSNWVWKDKLGNIYGEDYYLHGNVMSKKDWLEAVKKEGAA